VIIPLFVTVLTTGTPITAAAATSLTTRSPVW
jgi:hypothetical protein